MVYVNVGSARMSARVVVWLAVSLVLALSLVDLGSVVLTRMRLDDDLKSAGFAGATAIQGQQVSSQAAQTAYGAAATNLGQGETIDPQTFAVRPDGGVSLTVTMTAPTLFFKHLGFLSGFTQVEDSYEQPRIGY